MSLKNFILPETFLTIAHFSYEKNHRRCVASINIFEDDTRSNLIGTTSVEIDGNSFCPEVESVKNLRKIPPAEPTAEDKKRFFIIPNDGEGEWANCENYISQYDPVACTWVRWRLDNNPWVVIAADDNKYYRWTGTEWVLHDNMCNDRRLWEKFMTPDVAMSGDTNPVKQMYIFMKTLKKFEHCVDC